MQNILFTQFVKFSLYFLFLFSRIIFLFACSILHGFFIGFFCFLSFCQHFFFLYFFQPSHLLLPFLSVSVTSFFLTFSLLLIAYFHFLIFFLRVYSCIYRFQTFPSCLFPGTQKYTRQSGCSEYLRRHLIRGSWEVLTRW